MPSADVFREGAAAGFSKDVLKRAKDGCVKSIKVRDSWFWQLTDVDDEQQGTTESAAREQGSKAQEVAPLLPCPPIPVETNSANGHLAEDFVVARAGTNATEKEAS